MGKTSIQKHMRYLCNGGVLMAAGLIVGCGGQRSEPAAPAPAPELPAVVETAPEQELIEEPAAEETAVPVAAEPAAPAEEPAASYDEEVDPIVAEMLEQLEADSAALRTDGGPLVRLQEGFEFPEDIQLPEDIVIQLAQEDDDGTITMQGTTPGQADAVAAHFREMAAEQGWDAGDSTNLGSGEAVMQTLTFSKDGRTLTVELISSFRVDGTQLTVRVVPQ